MGIAEAFLYGLVGGMFAELLGLFKLRHQAPGKLSFVPQVRILLACDHRNDVRWRRSCCCVYQVRAFSKPYTRSQCRGFRSLDSRVACGTGASYKHRED